MVKNILLSNIAKAIFTVSRHAKTAPGRHPLYHINKESINQLLSAGRAERIWLHFADHPKFSNQHSPVLVSVDDDYSHILPEKEDFEKFEHLGSLDQNYRNPRTKMSLSQAKRIIYEYINWQPKKRPKNTHKYSPSNYYTPSSLGKMEWPPRKSHRNVNK